MGSEPSDRIPHGHYLSDIHGVGGNLSLSSTIIVTFDERRTETLVIITHAFPIEVPSDITSDTDGLT